jgi:hypothetical protein
MGKSFISNKVNKNKINDEKKILKHRNILMMLILLFLFKYYFINKNHIINIHQHQYYHLIFLNLEKIDQY